MADQQGEEPSEETELVEKKGTTLQVWTYFGLKKEEKDSEKVVCRLCRKSVLACGSNTSSLVSHLKNHHPNEHSTFMKGRKTKTSEKSSDKSEPKMRQVRKLCTCNLIFGAADDGRKSPPL